MERSDDRTDEQLDTHTTLVVGVDTCLSGWGQADGGLSVAAWACKPEHTERVLEWVENRSDMKRVQVTDDDFRPPQGTKHFKIYAVRDTHPSLQ